MEKWKEIAGFDGYWVSDHGRVSSTRDRHNGHGSKARILKPGPSATGHMRVTLTDRTGNLQYRWVHRLVLESFCGGSTADRPFTDHVDRNPANNRLSNLRWCSSRENQRNRGVGGVHWDARKERWRVRIRIGNPTGKGQGKRVSFGTYASLSSARAALKKFRAIHHGEFAPCG